MRDASSTALNDPRLWSPPPPETGRIEMGTIGWDDNLDVADQGSAANDGRTYIKVTLFRGKSPVAQPTNVAPPVPGAPTPMQAQGLRVLAMLNTLAMIRVPKRGAVCLVAFPAGFDGNPEACFLLAASEITSGIGQFADDRAVMDFGDDVHVLFRGKSLTFMDANASRFISVGQPRSGGAPGITLQDETGSGLVVQSGVVGAVATDNGSPPNIKAFFQMKPSEIDLALPGFVGLVMKNDGTIEFVGANFNANTAGGNLGTGATPATKIAINAGGAAASATWNVSP